MKKTFIAGAIAAAFLLLALIVFLPDFTATADKDYPYEGDEPDMPAFLKTDIGKEEFMRLRAEYVGLKRGLGDEEDGKIIDPKIRQNAIVKMQKQQNTLAAQPVSDEKTELTAAWTPIGPAPIPNGQTSGVSTAVSGRTVAIAVHPTNPNIVYVGTAQGGLYRTTDGGTNWTPMLDGALSLAVNTVAIAPSQPETIFVGTGESGFSADSFFGVGIYRIDNASSASPTITGPLNKNAANADVFSGRAIGKIVVHPTDPNIIFASSTSGGGGIGGAGAAIQANRGLFRSTNAMSATPTFAQLTIAGLAAQNRNILDIAIDPGNPNLLLCTEADSFGTGEGGVYRTTDALADAPTFTRTFTAGVGTDASRTELALNRSSLTGIVTVYAASGFNGGTLQRSIDGGATWTQQIDNNFCSPQCFYDIALDVDPTNADRVYLGGAPSVSFAFSVTGGLAFTTSAIGLHSDSHVIAVAPSQPATIYFGSDGGIYKSTNSGITWTSLNNSQFSATQFMSIAVHPTDPNFSIGGTQDNGTNYFKSNQTWTRADYGDGGYAVIDQNATDATNVRMYHTYYNNTGLMGYASVTSTASAADGNWTFRGCQSSGTTANGISCNGKTLFYAPLTRGPGNPNTIYYGTDRLYRSDDGGLNNTVVSQNPIALVPNSSPPVSDPISAIGISPQNDNVRIVGLRGGGIWGTTIGSATLTNLDAGNAVPNGFVARAVIDPANANTAYVTLSSFGVTTVWKTTNLSAASPTWTAISGSGATALPQVPVSAFAVDSTNSNTLYAGTDIGVYTSTDGGASWIPFGTGLPRVAVFDMAVTAGRKLRIATHGRGMWELTLSKPARAAFDYDGDGKADLSVYRPSNGFWYLFNSNTGYTGYQFGVSTDRIVPADYDGDGKTDVAVYRDGTWFVLRSRDGFAAYNFGTATDIPAPADFDGDGRSELAVYRPAEGVWFQLNLATNVVTGAQFGTSEDKPVAADYDADGKADLAVYRPSNGVWYLLRSKDGYTGYQFGVSTDNPVPADYDGDGKTDAAVWRASESTWYILKSNGLSFYALQFGVPTDVPIPADYDGDGKADIAVYRPEAGDWYQLRTTTNQFTAFNFGLNGDVPTPNAFVR